MSVIKTSGREGGNLGARLILLHIILHAAGLLTPLRWSDRPRSPAHTFVVLGKD